MGRAFTVNLHFPRVVCTETHHGAMENMHTSIPHFTPISRRRMHQRMMASRARSYNFDPHPRVLGADNFDPHLRRRSTGVFEHQIPRGRRGDGLHPHSSYFSTTS